MDIKIYKVYANNGRSYEDYEDYFLLIGAETEEKAKDEAINIWAKNPYVEIYKVSVSANEIITTDNGIAITISG